MKKRVLVVNKFYYRRGGDCVYTLNLERLLREQGHEVAVMAMQFPENEPSPWAKYWPAQVDFGGGASAKISALKRTLGMGDVVEATNRLLDDFRPDVVHLNNIHSYLSPVVARLARSRGIRVVWTLHDYKLLCPSYSCLRQGQNCELCFRSKWSVVGTRCMKGSLAASALAWIEAQKWNRTALQRVTDLFICPSAFMASKMAQGGFDPAKLTTLCNFVAPELIESYRAIDPTASAADYYCYIGRLSPEKGVATMLRAAANLPYKLKVAGDGPLLEELREAYASAPNIEFLGRINGPAVKALLADARFSVLPSEWYENNPLGVIESLCAGTPVVGARNGGIPELITAGRGEIFEPGSADSLSEAIERAWSTPYDRTAIRAQALADFSPEAYYARLLDIYNG